MPDQAAVWQDDSRPEFRSSAAVVRPGPLRKLSSKLAPAAVGSPKFDAGFSRQQDRQQIESRRRRILQIFPPIVSAVAVDVLYDPGASDQTGKRGGLKVAFVPCAVTAHRSRLDGRQSAPA